MKTGKPEKKRKQRLSNLQNKIVVCFTVPILFMILVGVIAYRKASTGMSQQFLDSTEKTMNMTVSYMEAINSFVAGEALKYAFDTDLNRYFSGVYEKDGYAVERKKLITNQKTNLLSTQSGNDFISNVHIIPSQELTLISTTNSDSPNGFRGIPGGSQPAGRRRQGKCLDGLASCAGFPYEIVRQAVYHGLSDSIQE